MQLEGIHHITAITGDAPRNVEFYVGTLGAADRQDVNQDDPTVYHLVYADEHGSPGSDLTFFEYPGAAPGRTGAGMVHRIVWRVGSSEAIDFWERRLAHQGAPTERVDGALHFSDPEGLEPEPRAAAARHARLLRRRGRPLGGPRPGARRAVRLRPRAAPSGSAHHTTDTRRITRDPQRTSCDPAAR